MGNRILNKQNSLIFFCVILIYVAAKNSALAASLSPKSIHVFSFMLFFIVLSSYRKLFLLVCIPFGLLSSLYLPVATAFGRMDYSFIASMINTDAGEAFEFLKLLAIKDMVRSLYIITTLIIYIKIISKYKIELWKIRPVTLILSLATLSTTHAFNLPKDFYQSSVKFIREHKDISGNKNSLSWEITDKQPKYKNYVLVIGESARRDYHGVYGYPANNTPFLSKATGTIVDGFIAGGPNTIKSLKLMLTDPEKENRNARKNFNVISLANSAMLDTFWLSNQGYSGEYDSYISSIANQSTEKFFIKGENRKKLNTDDFDLIPVFQEKINKQIKSNNRLFVLHLTGSHSYTCDRLHGFPNKYITSHEKYKELSCYLASIEKTDKLLESVNEILKKRNVEYNESYSMIYFSDHGLSSLEKEDGNISMRHLDVRQQYEVPLFKISSDDSERKFITARKSGLNLTAGLGNWMGIKTKTTDENYSLFSEDDDDLYGYTDLIKKLPDNPTIYIEKYFIDGNN